jgi:hypothetical protein
LGRNSRRRKRRPASSDAPGQAPANGNGNDRYTKYLPEWMRGPNGAPVRPPRPRRARQPRPAGGYTPGKAALRESALDL